jgi:hypothetical protein
VEVGGCVSALDGQGRSIWIVDAHRDDGERFVARAEEILTAFLELEAATRLRRIVFGGSSATTSSNVICIGTQGQDMSDSCFIGQIFGATVPGGSTVIIDANDRLGTMTSSKRFKEDIEPMDKASDGLFALKPQRLRASERFNGLVH